MTPENIQRVQSSWAIVRPGSDDAIEFFFDSVFMRDPALEMRINEHFADHKATFLSTLNMAIGWLDKPDYVIPALETLGARQAGQGFQQADYQTAGFALIDTLSVHLGLDFDDAKERAWIALIDYVAGIMSQSGANAPVIDRLAA